MKGGGEGGRGREGRWRSGGKGRGQCLEWHNQKVVTPKKTSKTL